MTTRAVILARGLGTRMKAVETGVVLTEDQRRAADAGMKAMMPIGGRPFVDYLFSAIADAGLGEAAIVVAPDHDLLRRHYTVDAPPARLRLEFIVQAQPIGTADAVLAAEAWTRREPFLVMNGDNLYPTAVIRDLATSDVPALPGFERADLVRTSNIEEARVNAFALVDTDGDGYLTRIVEKPRPGDARPDALVSMNIWRFDRRIFDACRQVPKSPRGEYELPLAVGVAARNGVRFKVLPAQGPVLDLSQRADAAEVARRLAGVSPRP
jgi:dTDP-glucose pyrophosphorylase